MKAVAAIATLLFLATSLFAQGPAAAANATKAHLSRKETKHLRKVKKQALQFGKWDQVCVRLADRSHAEGQLMGVNNEGIQMCVWFPKCGKRKVSVSPQDASPRFIQFSQIRSINVSKADSYPSFTMGAMAGILGPLGWWAEWLRAED
jgi:hypothetical protein